MAISPDDMGGTCASVPTALGSTVWTASAFLRFCRDRALRILAVGSRERGQGAMCGGPSSGSGDVGPGLTRCHRPWLENQAPPPSGCTG